MNCATQRAGSFRRLTAAFLTVAVAVSWPATLVHSSEARAVTSAVQSAAFAGVVFGADGLTALKGASVKAAHLPSGQIFVSRPTGADGRYSISSLPAGEYDLAVETPAGLYAAATTLNAIDGKRLAVSFAVAAGAQEPPPAPPEPATPEPPAPDPPVQAPPEPEPQKKERKGGSFWRSPAGAAILIVGGGLGAAALAGAATDGDDDEDSMSP